VYNKRFIKRGKMFIFVVIWETIVVLAQFIFGIIVLIFGFILGGIDYIFTTFDWTTIILLCFVIFIIVSLKNKKK
jgi:di/tricarboxylate transporter